MKATLMYKDPNPHLVYHEGSEIKYVCIKVNVIQFGFVCFLDFLLGLKFLVNQDYLLIVRCKDSC